MITAVTDTPVAQNVLKIASTYGKKYTADMYSPISNTFSYVLSVRDDTPFTTDTTISIQNASSEAVSVKLKLEKYVAPIIELGQEYEIHIAPNATTFEWRTYQLGFTWDTTAQYKITVGNIVTTGMQLRITSDNKTITNALTQRDKNGSDKSTWIRTFSYTTEIAKINISSSQGVLDTISFKIEKVEA